VLSYFHLRAQECDALLDRISVEDVWGIGRKSVIKLQLHNIFTAKQLRDADLVWIRRTLKVVGVRIVLELRGMSCLPLETAPKPKQGIMASQSFGRPVESLKELEEAVATYTSIAAVKLRRQHSQASHMSV
jgi:DNA polymerase V